MPSSRRTLPPADSGAGEPRQGSGTRAWGGGIPPRVCRRRNPSTRMAAAAPRRPAASPTTGSYRAEKKGQRAKVNQGRDLPPPHVHIKKALARSIQARRRSSELRKNMDRNPVMLSLRGQRALVAVVTTGMKSVSANMSHARTHTDTNMCTHAHAHMQIHTHT